MNPELEASASFDRTIDRAEMANDTGSAYKTFLDEVHETRKQISEEGFNSYVELINGAESYQVNDIAIGYALSNFELIDEDSDGELELAEIEKRRKSLRDRPEEYNEAESDLPAQAEDRMLASLEDRFGYLPYESRDTYSWSLGFLESKNITGMDLSVSENRINSLRASIGTKPLYDGPDHTDDVRNIPKSVKDLLSLGGVSIETVDGKLARTLAHHIDRYPTISFAAGIYSGQTNEIITQNDRHVDQYRQHEIGHYIDDVMEAGVESFSDSEQFNDALSKDMADLNPDTDWQKEIPGLHPYVLNALNRGSFTDYSTKELFAELYQSADSDTAMKLREHLPHTGALVDQKLMQEKIDRFPQESTFLGV